VNPRLKTRKAKLPFVLVNMAMTADGKIASTNRAVSSFTSARDREHLLELRATVDAVLAGARTVDAAPISLGPGPAKFRRQRLKRGLTDYNLRVIVSRSGSVSPRAKVFSHRFSPIIILTTSCANAGRLKRLRALADLVKIFGRDEVNFRAAFRWLRQRWGVKRLLCEGGGELNDALFRAGLVDELHLTISPKIFGGRHAPTIAEGRGFNRLVGAKLFRLKSTRFANGELFTVFVRV
jgi:2,5-diamino-6-(ribosylamino)-4(3H)-pyrimidinone 5'-phosphate reductase